MTNIRNLKYPDYWDGSSFSTMNKLIPVELLTVRVKQDCPDNWRNDLDKLMKDQGFDYLSGGFFSRHYQRKIKTK